MNKSQIIDQIKLSGYFDIKELVCDHVYQKFGEKSWQFLDQNLLETIFVIRHEIVKSPMYCNNWAVSNRLGRRFSERGLRCNLSYESSNKTMRRELYMSAHCNGNAIDFDVRGMSANSVRNLIISNQNKLPHPIRMEDKVNWVHVDCFNYGNLNKITLFNP